MADIPPDPNGTTLTREGAPSRLPTLDAPMRSPGGAALDLPFPEVTGYRIVSRIGRGGMGEVYEAVNDRGHTVALKMIRRDRVSRTTIERFSREADALFELHHSNVAHFLAYGKSTGGEPYFTMKYVNGGTLAERMHEYQRDVDKAVGLILTVAEAVEYLHSKGFIHRDLKPQNVLLDREGQPYISDFGLVKDLDELMADDALPRSGAPGASESMTLRSNAETRLHYSCVDGADRAFLTAGAIGTLPYASPEQLLNQKAQIGPASDIWALGIIFYELLCGARPFDESEGTDLRDTIRTKSPRPLSEVVPRIDATLERIVLKCLAKKPEERYASVAAFAGELRDWVNRSRGANEPKPAVARKRALVYGLIGVAAVASLATAIVLIFFPNRDKKEPEKPDDTGWAALRREIDANGKAIVVENNRVAKYFTQLSGVEPVDATTHADRIVMNASRMNLFEFASELPPGRYRIEAQMRLVHGTGYAGLYVGRSFQPTTDGREHFMVGVTFFPANPKKKALEGVVTFNVQSCREANPNGFKFADAILDQYLPVPDDGWRNVELTISAIDIAASVDGRTLGRKTRNALQYDAARIGVGRPQFAGVTPTFTVAEGVGLYVKEDAVEVRAITITPLREEQ